MRVAVTGATGFIGRHLTKHLAERGIEVRAVVRPRAAPPDVAGASVVISPLDAAPLAEACRGADALVHLAGVVSAVDEQEYFAVNAGGARAAAGAARSLGAHLVHISSLSVAGPATRAAPSREDDPPNPLTAYARSKLEGERIVQATTGLHWTILRPVIVYGPGDRAMLPLFKWAATGLLPFIGPDEAAYTFVHVADVARAIEASLASAGGHLWFVGHPQVVDRTDLLAGFERALGRPVRALRVPYPIAWTGAQVGEVVGRVTGRLLPLNRARLAEMTAPGFVCSVDRMREHLGFEAAIPIDEGLADTAAWYRRHGWL